MSAVTPSQKWLDDVTGIGSECYVILRMCRNCLCVDKLNILSVSLSTCMSDVVIQVKVALKLTLKLIVTKSLMTSQGRLYVTYGLYRRNV